MKIFKFWDVKEVTKVIQHINMFKNITYTSWYPDHCSIQYTLASFNTKVCKDRYKNMKYWNFWRIKSEIGKKITFIFTLKWSFVLQLYMIIYPQIEIYN